MKKIVRWALLITLCLLLWQTAALVIDNSLVCPAPAAVLKVMAVQLQSPSFFSAVSATLLRMIAGLLLSFVSGVSLAALCFRFRKLAWICAKLVTFLQSIPNVAYIILLLFWTGRNESVILVQFFLIFPIVWRDFYEVLTEIGRKWHEVFYLYPQPLPELLQKAALPLLRPALYASLKSASSLGLKSAVMAEILASVSNGIGRSLQVCRLNLDFAGVIGWVLWLVLLSALLERFWSFVFDRLFQGAG